MEDVKNRIELTDTDQKFELKINGVAIKRITNYKLEATPYSKILQLTLEIPNEEIRNKINGG